MSFWMQGVELSVAVAQGQARLNRLASGDVLKVLATDGGSRRDFAAFARLAGHRLLHESVEAGVYGYWLQKA